MYLICKESIMKKIAIVLDSSAGLTLEEQSKLDGVFVAPLSVIYNNVEYIDQIELTLEEIQDILSRNELIKTSQPSVGSALALYESILAQGYDKIIVLSLSSALSGTFNSFSAAAQSLENADIHVVDTMTVAGAVQEGWLLIRKLEAEGKSVDEILEALDRFYKHTVSYVLPENLDQLKASGRISPAAAAVASLLKMKVILRLENHGPTIEKFATARTETKLFNTLMEDINKHIEPELDKFFILHSLSEEKTNKLKDELQKLYPGIEVEISYLPAALSGHAGNGTIVLQLFRNHKLFS